MFYWGVSWQTEAISKFNTHFVKFSISLMIFRNDGFVHEHPAFYHESIIYNRAFMQLKEVPVQHDFIVYHAPFIRHELLVFLVPKPIASHLSEVYVFEWPIVFYPFVVRL